MPQESPFSLQNSTDPIFTTPNMSQTCSFHSKPQLVEPKPCHIPTPVHPPAFANYHRPPLPTAMSQLPPPFDMYQQRTSNLPPPSSLSIPNSNHNADKRYVAAMRNIDKREYIEYPPAAFFPFVQCNAPTLVEQQDSQFVPIPLSGNAGAFNRCCGIPGEDMKNICPPSWAFSLGYKCRKDQVAQTSQALVSPRTLLIANAVNYSSCMGYSPVTMGQGTACHCSSRLFDNISPSVVHEGSTTVQRQCRKPEGRPKVSQGTITKRRSEDSPSDELKTASATAGDDFQESYKKETSFFFHLLTQEAPKNSISSSGVDTYEAYLGERRETWNTDASSLSCVPILPRNYAAPGQLLPLGTPLRRPRCPLCPEKKRVRKFPCEHCHRKHDGRFGGGRFCSSKCARTVGGIAHKKKRLRARGIPCDERGNIMNYFLEASDQERERIILSRGGDMNTGGHWSKTGKCSCAACTEKVSGESQATSGTAMSPARTSEERGAK